MKLTAITGGIGSGKSVVSEILRCMGYEVYDCDSRAKILMDTTPIIKERIAAEICADAVNGSGEIDRVRLASEVFADTAKLNLLNAIVHEAVRQDIEQWASVRDRAFVETAILYQSGLDLMVDCVWQVVAPVALRVERVMRRSAMSESEVRARIKAQDSYISPRLHSNVVTINNDGVNPVLPRVIDLLS